MQERTFIVLCVNERRECRSDVYAAVCAAHASTHRKGRNPVLDGYTKAEHESALDRLLDDLAAFDPSDGFHGPTGPKLRLAGGSAMTETKPGAHPLVAHAV